MYNPSPHGKSMVMSNPPAQIRSPSSQQPVIGQRFTRHTVHSTSQATSHIMHAASKTIRPQRRRGFTLIELMIVVLLVAIFAALALPSFDSTMQRYRVNTSAYQIANALQFARAQAIATRNNVSIGPTGTPTGGCTAGGTDWHCGIDVNELTAPPILRKTLPTTDFKAVNVQVGGGVTGIISYSPFGLSTGGVDGLIYVWPSNTPNTAATSPYTYTVCAGMGGRIKVTPKFVTNVIACQ